jgi:peptidylprolyl isomerase
MFLIAAGLGSLCTVSCWKQADDGNKKEEVSMKTEQQTTVAEVVTTNSGLSYKVLEAPKEHAEGPQKGNVVVVHYTGWIGDENNEPDMNRKFDSSHDRRQPFAFTVGVGQVIAGWDEGVVSMKKGEKRRLIIPSKLGYGASGIHGVIPPNATLVFDVELIDFKG